MTNFAAVARHLSNAGYSAAQVEAGIAYARQSGASDEDEALSLAASKILYSADQLEDGARFAVDSGSVDWVAE